MSITLAIILLPAIIALLIFAAKVVWDTAEIYELRKMRAEFEHKLEDTQESGSPEFKRGLEEAESMVDEELDHLAQGHSDLY